MDMVRSDLGAMCRWMKLTEVICKIFLSPVPMNSRMLLCNLICNPKVPHFHGSRELFLDSICYCSGSGIIRANWSGWLGMSHFFQNETDDFPSLGFTKRAPRFDSAVEATRNYKRDVRTSRLFVLIKPSKEKVCCKATFCFGHTRVIGIRVDVKYHIGFFKSDFGCMTK